MNENDLRVQRTRRLLREAFIELATANGYENVSVRDITTKAQVGYQTFYRHYAGKEAFVATLAWEILVDIQATVSPGTTLESAEKSTYDILAATQKHAELMSILLASTEARKMITPMLTEGIKQGKLLFGGTDIPDELVGFYFSMGLLELIRWWVEGGMVYSPEQMAEYINLLVIRSTHSLIERRPKRAEGGATPMRTKIGFD